MNEEQSRFQNETFEAVIAYIEHRLEQGKTRGIAQPALTAAVAGAIGNGFVGLMLGSFEQEAERIGSPFTDPERVGRELKVKIFAAIREVGVQYFGPDFRVQGMGGNGDA